MPSRRAPSVVFEFRQGPGIQPVDLDDLWARALGASAWSPSRERLVIAVAGSAADSLLGTTATSLMRYLQREGVRAEIEVEAAGEVVAGGDPVRVKSCCFRDGVPLPESAFDDSDRITVCRPSKHPTLRHTSILGAQAARLPLTETCRLALAREAIFEAHRLLRSDLAVVCGPVDPKREERGRFWAVGDSDLALEAAVARAMGLEFSRLPHIRYLARRRLLPEGGDALPDAAARLRGYATSRPVALAGTLVAPALRGAFSAVEDLRRLKADLPRVAAALKRRLGLAPRL